MASPSKLLSPTFITYHFFMYICTKLKIRENPEYGKLYCISP